MNITETVREEGIVLSVEGRIDTNTSGKLQMIILNAFQKAETVEVDLKECNYVSSAGLRVFLIGEKTAISKGRHLELTNVCADIMEVFSMTGFDKILHIS